MSGELWQAAGAGGAGWMRRRWARSPALAGEAHHDFLRHLPERALELGGGVGCEVKTVMPWARAAEPASRVRVQHSARMFRALTG